MIKEKRKWQIAFRRYVLEGTPSQAYAHYFGIDKVNLRGWFEMQFRGDLSWDNHGTMWQFDHVVPVVYFDFDKEEDLYLCWNFINIRVEPIHLNKARGNRVDVLGVRQYFIDLFEKTGYVVAQKMIDKIETLEASNIESNESLVSFLKRNKNWLDEVVSLSVEEFSRFNTGTSIKDIMLEREILKKFG